MNWDDLIMMLLKRHEIPSVFEASLAFVVIDGSVPIDVRVAGSYALESKIPGLQCIDMYLCPNTQRMLIRHPAVCSVDVGTDKEFLKVDMYHPDFPELFGGKLREAMALAIMERNRNNIHQSQCISLDKVGL